MENNNYLDILKSRYFSTLCTAVGGIERAYILHRIHCWVMSNKRLNKNKAYAEGQYWMFSTLKQLHELEFPFMSERNFQRHIYALQDMGVLVSDLHNRKKTSRKWYRINYDALNQLCEKTEREINQSVSEDELPSFRQNDEYCEDGSRQNDEVRTPVLVKVANTSRQNDDNEPQTFAKMTNSFRQNDETIETNKENNSLYYSSLSGSLSLLESSFDEFLRNPDADIEAFESQLFEFEKVFVNCRAESAEDHKAYTKIGVNLAKMRKAIEERKKANRFDYDYDDQPEDHNYEEPTGQTAISLGDMIDKYENAKCQNDTQESQKEGESVKMTLTKCQNDTTIEKIEETINTMYVSLFGSSSLFGKDSRTNDPLDMWVLQIRVNTLETWLKYAHRETEVQIGVCNRIQADVDKAKEMIDEYNNADEKDKRRLYFVAV